jgi:hypothetical protein
MKCDYCNQEIPEGSQIISDGHHFCSTFHRYSWQTDNITKDSPLNKSNEKKKGDYKKQLGIALTTIGIIIGSFFGQKMASNLFGTSSSINQQLMSMASELNKSCPINVDKDTRLDNVIVGSGNSFSYNYTLINLTSSQIDPRSLNDYLKPRLINVVKTSPEMKYFRDNSITIEYRYSDKDGIFVLSIPITPKDYK